MRGLMKLRSPGLLRLGLVKLRILRRLLRLGCWRKLRGLMRLLRLRLLSSLVRLLRLGLVKLRTLVRLLRLGCRLGLGMVKLRV